MTRGTRRRWVTITLAGLLAATAAACTTTVDGTARVAAPAPVAAAAPGVAAPKDGGAPDDGAEPGPVAPPPPGPGRYAEAKRLAGATALVQTTFPERTVNCLPQDEYVDARTLEGAYWAPGTAEPVLERYGFVAAWGECASEAGFATMTLSVELSDPASARAAARELAAAAQQSTDRVSTVLDGATALVSTDRTTDTVQVWAPVGRTVAYLHHRAPAGQGLDGALRVAGDQVRLLAGFVPTPQAEVPALPRDPHGLRDLTVDPPGLAGPADGSYDPEPYLRVSSHPLQERELLAANGFVGAYAKSTVGGPLSYAVAVYAFPTSAQTNAVYEVFAEEETTVYGGTPFRLPSVPDAPCSVSRDELPGSAPSYTQLCYAGYGGHMAGVTVAGLSAPDDVAEMDRLLVAQRDLLRR